MAALSGILNVAKPAGLTSRQIVDRAARLVRPARAGHAGTLDPLATGVLVVCIGQATRLIEYVQRMPKTYEGEFLLGRTSDTEDVTGAVVEFDSPPVPTWAEIETAAGRLVGTILQRPPAYSALKVQGQRAYDLARAGKEVDLQPRPIEVYSIDVLEYDYPRLRLRIHCGSGTYVRSLGRDLAESLGTGAVMSALVRTAIGGFTLDEACDIEAVYPEQVPTLLLPMNRAVAMLPSMTVSDVERHTLSQGKMIVRADAPAGDEIAALDAAGQLVSLLRPAGDGRLAPSRNFA